MAAEVVNKTVAEQLCAMVVSFNEEANIARTLERLRWVPRILLLDSFSTDETLAIASRFQNVTVLQRPFDSFAGQCNWGLSQIDSEWVLSLDADYVLTRELVDEIARLPDHADIAGYSARFRYCIDGVPLRKTILPARTILYRRSCATYHNEGHGHRVRLAGATRELSGYILHDDRKPLARWLRSQISYAEIEAAHLLSTPNKQLKAQDRLRKMIAPAPFLMFGYTLVAQMLILDGWRGWFYVLQRVLAEVLLSLNLLVAKLENRPAAESRSVESVHSQ
jgi:glycosyltransferase involved in cell wall biosynthesis